MTVTQPGMLEARQSAMLSSLEYILSPMTIDEFLSDWYEKKPFHLSRKTPAYFDRWLSLDAFLKVLTTVHPDLLELTAIIKDTAVTPIGLQRAMDAFRNGSTIVANGVHQIHEPLIRLCRELEIFFLHAFQTNIYFTPAGNRGFRPHFDVHDVFILQIHGAKHWRVYEPNYELPMTEQLSVVELTEAMTPVIDASIEAGDLLYLPRGWIHAGVAGDHGVSLHVSVGLLGYTWRDALLQAVERVALRDPRLRRNVPMGPLASLSASDGLAALAEAAALVLGELRMDGVATARETFVLGSPAILPDLPIAEWQQPLTLDSVVKRHPMVNFVMNQRPGYVEVLFLGKRLQYPLPALDCLEFVLGQPDGFSIRDIRCGLDEQNRLRLVHALCREGLLQRLHG